ncbi:DNA (cytosine-5-)-methyltransferase [Candidatus Pacearchaeota archaeon]|nr:DNA (cytosine-5-)-methyltransferase [Candidatus Pacearchaeota archaeon]
MNYLDLFSGIGGFHKGLEEAGFEFNWTGHSEIDKYAKSIYQGHFKESEDLGDVSNINVQDLPRSKKWIVTGGWPCQDNSIAGKRKGQSSGTRSGLLSQIIRLIRELTEMGAEVVFIGENVKGLFSVNDGVDFLDSIRGLTYLDTNCQQLTLEMQLLNTLWFLPQNRERVYFVGYNRGRSGQQIFPIGEEFENVRGKGKGFKDGLWSQAIDSNYYKGPDGKRTMIKVKRHPLKFLDRNQKNIEGDYAFTVDSMNTGGVKINSDIRRFTPLEIERLQGFPDGWTEYGKDGEKISDTQRYKTLGNAVSVPVVKAVGERVCQN